ncbi:conserved hypothetical protein [Ricinus communis]|uniref:RNase H type-1 domain-containing protein n=1 Tax=Ricinus communis TaxID=3988 RepID=B9T3I2_RICCO|nr:conserved hypothetical protein [Ricinus communis]
MVIGCYVVEEAKALGFRKALSWIWNMQISNIIFEVDSKVVVDTFLSSEIKLMSLK